jgi:glutamyl-tRNA synthetase
MMLSLPFYYKMKNKIRTRFAPSPTGPLHMGGVRTALYAYLFAKKNNGDFILRIEDTDQNRFVKGAEEYIIESLKWCNIIPDEGVGFGGQHEPYRQSERKVQNIYMKYAQQLIDSGFAYYAFDTTEELDIKRKEAESSGSSFLYSASTRMSMKNSLTLSVDEVRSLQQSGASQVIRLKIPAGEEISFTDMIRGEVTFNSSLVDDKVLIKADEMPTYHLAHIVDDIEMEITHAIRGEEWLPSAPAHIYIYRFLGLQQSMPQYAHLPLLLKPEGNGKLSKRDGDRLGFPVFPLQWTDPVSGEVSSGYREKGYYSEAFVNILALLGWNDGTEKEIFSMKELVDAFSIERIHKAGAKFDPEKAKWINQQYLKMQSDESIAERWMIELKGKNIDPDLLNEKYVAHAVKLIREKIHFENELWKMGSYLFIAPETFDEQVTAKKWNAEAEQFFHALYTIYIKSEIASGEQAEKQFKELAAAMNINPGSMMQLFRIIVSGVAAGVALFDMVALLGNVETAKRIQSAITIIKKNIPA